MITPTVGQVIWYHPHGSAETRAAIVTLVNDDGTVNLSVLQTNAREVKILQDGASRENNEECAEIDAVSNKTEILEAKLHAATEPETPPT
jgi:hypothetical protein